MSKRDSGCLFKDLVSAIGYAGHFGSHFDCGFLIYLIVLALPHRAVCNLNFWLCVQSLVLLIKLLIHYNILGYRRNLCVVVPLDYVLCACLGGSVQHRLNFVNPNLMLQALNMLLEVEILLSLRLDCWLLKWNGFVLVAADLG